MNEDSQLNLVNFSSAKLKKIKLSTKDIPREGNVDRVLDLLSLLSTTPEGGATELNLGQASYDHVVHLAKVMGFVTDGGGLTNSAKALMVLGKSGQYSRMAIALEESTVVKAWCQWSCVESMSELNVDSCKDFMNYSASRLNISTKRSRTSVLRRLVNTLNSHHPSARDVDFEEYLEPSRGLILRDEPVFGRRVIDVVNRIKFHSSFVRVSTGWMTAGGYDMVVRKKEGTSMKILLGADDHRGRELLESPLDYFRKSVGNGKPSARKRLEHIRLYKDLASGTSRMKELHPRVLDRLHAKGYYFGDKVGLSTSANMTWNGLVGNVESGYVMTDPDHMRFNITEYEKLFELAEDVTAPVLEAIEDSWIFQDPVLPYLAYIRGLIEMFGNIASENRSEVYHLADFQQMIVASTLHSLSEHRRCILISPTGTGKTVMGSYVIAAESTTPERKILVFAPNEAVRKKWEQATFAFGRTPRVYSHTEIQNLSENPDDSEFGREMKMFVDDNTLIVVDEAHRFRTEGRSGEKNLRRILDGSINGSSPMALFLTATPIGVGFENLQTLYSMLFQSESIEALEFIESAPGLVNITLPFIINRFGITDSSGNKYLNYSSSNKYFAKRTQSMSFIQKGNEKIFSRISELCLTREKPNPILDADSPSLGEFGFEMDPVPEMVATENMNFARTGLARSINSSKSAAVESFTNLLDGFDSKGFAEPEKTREQLLEIQKLIEEEFDDSKYQELLRKIRGKKDEKILIFTGRKSTVSELVERLSSDLPKVKVAAHEGTPKQRKELRESFAPHAHGKKKRKSEQLDILVSTDSLSEGVDLQDASVTVDYDLWWTPLTLQQRMGRLDRPTDSFREFEVWRFVNITPSFSEIVKIDKYLSERSKILKRIIADGAYEEEDIRDWERNEDQGIVTVKIEEIEEMANSEELAATSFHIADLAEAEDEAIVEATKLPANFVTSTKGEEDGTFVMFKHEGERHLAHLSHDTGKISFSPGDSQSEKVLGIIRSTTDTPLVELPEDHYEYLGELMELVCEFFDYDVEDTEPIFSAAIRKTPDCLKSR